MSGRWGYRIVSVGGAALLTIGAVVVANSATVQQLFSLLPVVGPLPFDGAAGEEFVYEAAMATAVVVGALFPLYKPQPCRILDTWFYALKRITVALLAMATIGYADATYALPRATLIVTGVVLVITVPVWFVMIRRRPRGDGERTVIVGDNPDVMAEILPTIDGTVLGYVSPPVPDSDAVFTPRAPELTDGGTVDTLSDVSNLGGLSRLDDIFVDYGVDTAVLAFTQPDRAEFFGTLDTCYEYGVVAKVHRKYADVVLTNEPGDGLLVEIDLEPWDWFDRVTKRLFDVAFAGTALLVLSPLLLVIAVAIKIDSPGPVLYRQTRTATFGDTFTIAKFRSMVTDAEAGSGATLSEEDEGGRDPRVTRVGGFLRQTHLDEIPQLLAILRGQMSVVGPRPERPELDSEMEAGTNLWRRRWFVKPGLTGLAQINDATGFDPEEKLRYDVAYIRSQSFWFDLKIVIRQLWMVGEDLVGHDR